MKPGVSGKMAVVNGATLLVLTFKEEQLDLCRKKPGDNDDDDDDFVGGDNDNDDVEDNDDDDDDDLMLLPARSIPGG